MWSLTVAHLQMEVLFRLVSGSLPYSKQHSFSRANITRSAWEDVYRILRILPVFRLILRYFLGFGQHIVDLRKQPLEMAFGTVLGSDQRGPLRVGAAGDRPFKSELIHDLAFSRFEEFQAGSDLFRSRGIDERVSDPCDEADYGDGPA